MTEVLDLRGEAVKVGDTIAYAATDGRSGGMRVGKLVKIVEAHETEVVYDHLSSYTTSVPLKIQVSVEHTSGVFGRALGKTITIDPSLKRFVLIEKAPPAPPVPKTREEMAAFATEWDAKVEAGRK